MLFVVFSINLRRKSESFESFSFTRDLLAITPSRLKSENRFQKFRIIYELKLVFLNSASDWVIS